MRLGRNGRTKFILTNIKNVLMFSCLGLVCMSSNAFEINSADVNSNNSTVLRIATKIVQPFVFKHESSGEWDGFSLDFVKLMLPRMENYSHYTMLEYANNNEIFDAVLRGDADIGHASITKNQERERFIDFSHTFFDSGFQVMVHNNLDVAASTAKFLSNFFTTVLLQGVMAFVIKCQFPHFRMHFGGTFCGDPRQAL